MAELAGLPTTTITTAREIAGKIREEQAAQESAQHADHNDAQTEESLISSFAEELLVLKGSDVSSDAVALRAHLRTLKLRYQSS